MKNLRTSVVKAIVASILTCTAGLAAAAGSTNLAVSGTVKGMCTFSAASTPMAFGDIDPSSLVNATASASVLYKCTKGTAAPAVTLDSGTTSRNLTGPAGELLAYTLGLGATVAGTGFGSGQDKTLAVTGTITPAAFANATAGLYTETVVLNITP